MSVIWLAATDLSSNCGLREAVAQCLKVPAVVSSSPDVFCEWLGLIQLLPLLEMEIEQNKQLQDKFKSSAWLI